MGASRETRKMAVTAIRYFEGDQVGVAISAWEQVRIGGSVHARSLGDCGALARTVKVSGDDGFFDMAVEMNVRCAEEVWNESVLIEELRETLKKRSCRTWRIYWHQFSVQ